VTFVAPARARRGNIYSYSRMLQAVLARHAPVALTAPSIRMSPGIKAFHESITSSGRACECRNYIVVAMSVLPKFCVCICMCVSVCVFMYICMYMYMYICAYVCMHACIHVLCVCINMSVYVWMYACTVYNIFTGIHVCICVC
jgi:hypothetical protein